MNILDAIDDPKLFGAAIRNPATWAPWRAFLACLFGLPIPEEQEALVAQCTGSLERQTRAFAEAWLICGRRAGKSFVLALIAVFLGCFNDYRQYLTLGERGTIMVVAADRRQSRTILRYVRGLLELPMLKRLVERETAEGFDLANRVTIEICTCSIKSVRGYTIVACLADEVAFWAAEDSASPDRDVLDSIRPGMATIPGAMLLCASSPYGRRGALWDAYRRHFGRADAPALIWQADTRTMNPTVPQRVIDEAMEADPASASAEYGAVFRTDVASFVSREVVEAAVDKGIFERPPANEVQYKAFADPSGGTRDSFTLAIVHLEGLHAVVDAIREVRSPFSPDSVVQDFAELLKSYRVRDVYGDRYAAEWPRERFAVHGITYRPAEKPKSDLYRDFLPVLNGGRCRLLDNPKLVAQLVGLERRTARGGRDSIDHAPNGFDDVANAVAGACCVVIGNGRRTPHGYSTPYITNRGMLPGGGVRRSLIANMPAPAGWDEQGQARKAQSAREQARTLLGLSDPSPEQVETIAKMLIREGRVAGWDACRVLQ